MPSLATDQRFAFVAWAAISAKWFRHSSSIAGRKVAMEMTEYGKRGRPKCRLLTLPALFGNPFGILTFPRRRRLAIGLLVLPQLDHRQRKGLVTDVSGLFRNACSA